MPGEESCTHHLILEPQEVGAEEVPLPEQQRGVALLQVSASSPDQRPDLGRGGERSHHPDSGQLGWPSPHGRGSAPRAEKYPEE